MEQELGGKIGDAAKRGILVEMQVYKCNKFPRASKES